MDSDRCILSLVMRGRLFFVAAMFIAGVIGNVCAQARAPAASEITATVERFHRALADGDRAAVLQLLAPDAIILEGGEAQTRAEYEREHLGDDIAFAHTTKSERSPSEIQQNGDAAWVTTKSKTTGTLNGRKIDSVGVELMVLTKGDAEWRIRAIHWSSHSSKK